MSLFIGILLGIFAVGVGFVVGAGELNMLILLSPIIVVIGGTIGAIIATFSIKGLTKMPGYIRQAILSESRDKEKLLQFFLKISHRVRMEGLLAVEGLLANGEYGKVDPFIERGLKLLIDGAHPELLKEILEKEMFVEEEIQKSQAHLFQVSSRYALEMGLIGTLLGYIQVFSYFSGYKIPSEAYGLPLLAALYGGILSCFFFIPISEKLSWNAVTKKIEKMFMLEGVIAIQAGENPIVLREKLIGFLSEDEKKRYFTQVRESEGE